jgi:hypothetical protein
MRTFRVFVIAAACCLALPTLAKAQASISGVVKDASGAVLPGVTVEAASPALIEKTREVVTDGSGQYRIVDLRPVSTRSRSRSPASAPSNGKASRCRAR